MKTAEADTYGIALPRTWTRIPTDPEDYAAFCDDISTRLAEHGAGEQARRGTELLLREVAKQLEEAQVVYSAVGVEITEGEDGPRLVTASVTLLTASQSDLGAPTRVTVDALLRAVSRADGNDDSRPLDIAPPARVSLPAGPAVRLRRHIESDLSAGTPDLYVETYLVPHDAGERLMTVQCATPNTALVSSFQSLFAKLADTVRIFAPGDPTTWDGTEGASGADAKDGEPAEEDRDS